MRGPEPPDAADAPEDGPWTPPGMSPLKKVGLTVLMVMLGVIPGLLLLASDPLPGPSDEAGPERRPSAEVDARDGAPADDAAPMPEASPPAVPVPLIPPQDAEVEDGDKAGRGEDDRGGQEDRPRRRSPTDDGRDDRGDRQAEAPDEDAGDGEREDDGGDDDADDEGWSISLRLGGR